MLPRGRNISNSKHLTPLCNSPTLLNMSTPQQTKVQASTAETDLDFLNNTQMLMDPLKGFRGMIATYSKGRIGAATGTMGNIERGGTMVLKDLLCSNPSKDQ